MRSCRSHKERFRDITHHPLPRYSSLRCSRRDDPRSLPRNEASFDRLIKAWIERTIERRAREFFKVRLVVAASTI